MATSKHLAIRDAVAALLAPLAVGRVHENRDYPLGEGVASQIHVYRLRSEPLRTNLSQIAPVDWTTDIRVLIKARTQDGMPAEETADELSCAVFAAVMGAQTLGGLADQIEPGPLGWEQEEGDHQVAAVTWDFSVLHRTQSNVIT